ncbi:alpha/beta hydrolase [Dyadobacter sp. CY312]|uniref:alpha/beta hydrolase n=1 Tax=Dyadobacter sp. CY312 TaxID=2907303 RepID=UPI001F3F777C|nr:alpha/beta hydrolase [Dyadobacter sp. CY312]MCE7041805.1 alpha/beta hydrolase [Dyadobacter sp. CY312]
MRNLLLLLLLFLAVHCTGQVALYPGTIPNSTNAENLEEIKFKPGGDSLAYKVSVPTISAFLPPKNIANGTAVIIFPGGGYHTLVLKREGSDVARAFNKLGVAAFVVKYRLPDDRTMVDKSIGPLQDAQQAIKTVRDRAREWNIDPEKIGLMGFSAGGHLAATAGTHFDKDYIPNKEKTALRPNFMLLVYPVISFSDSIGHTGSRQNLIGDKLPKGKIALLSNENHVSKNTPPTFLIHSGTDIVVPVANSLVFYQNMLKKGASAEIHLYSKGEHGFLTYPSYEEWFGRCLNWMKSLHLVAEK